MPSCTIDDNDIKRALNYLTNNKYNINNIISKKILDNGNIEIFWSYK